MAILKSGEEAWHGMVRIGKGEEDEGTLAVLDFFQAAIPTRKVEWRRRVSFR